MDCAGKRSATALWNRDQERCRVPLCFTCHRTPKSDPGASAGFSRWLATGVLQSSYVKRLLGHTKSIAQAVPSGDGAATFERALERREAVPPNLRRRLPRALSQIDEACLGCQTSNMRTPGKTYFF